MAPSRQVDQVATRFAVEEAGADHEARRIGTGEIRKGFFRISVESE
jgi:hypothetical protein